MDIGSHQIFDGGKNQALGRAMGGGYRTLPYDLRGGERRNGRVGHGDHSSYQRRVSWQEIVRAEFSGQIPTYFFIFVKVIRNWAEVT
jgi:hypothetical protein